MDPIKESGISFTDQNFSFLKEMASEVENGFNWTIHNYLKKTAPSIFSITTKNWQKLSERLQSLTEDKYETAITTHFKNGNLLALEAIQSGLKTYQVLKNKLDSIENRLKIERLLNVISVGISLIKIRESLSNPSKSNLNEIIKHFGESIEHLSPKDFKIAQKSGILEASKNILNELKMRYQQDNSIDIGIISKLENHLANIQKSKEETLNSKINLDKDSILYQNIDTLLAYAKKNSKLIRQSATANELIKNQKMISFNKKSNKLALEDKSSLKNGASTYIETAEHISITIDSFLEQFESTSLSTQQEQIIRTNRIKVAKKLLSALWNIKAFYENQAQVISGQNKTHASHQVNLDDETTSLWMAITLLEKSATDLKKIAFPNDSESPTSPIPLETSETSISHVKIETNFKVLEEFSGDYEDTEFEPIELEQIQYTSPVFKLAGKEVRQIATSDIEPGCVTVDLEIYSTKPAIERIRIAQKIFNRGTLDELMNSAIHFQIVTGVVDRAAGIFEISHATLDGATIKTETVNLNQLKPGSIRLVFKPNDKLRTQLFEVALTTANKQNPWVIKEQAYLEKGEQKKLLKILLVDPIFKGRKADLKKTARLAVDAHDAKIFFKKNQGELKAMSCCQFVANVTNTALIINNEKTKKILEDQDLSREEKTEKITTLLEKNPEILGGWYAFHDRLNSAHLTNQIFKNSDLWTVLGYIGTLGIEAPKLQKDTTRAFIPSDLKGLPFPIEDTWAIFDALDLIKRCGNEDEFDIKIKLAFAYLYAKNRITKTTKPLKPEDIIVCLLQKKPAEEKDLPVEEICTAYNAFYETIKKAVSSEKSPSDVLEEGIPQHEEIEKNSLSILLLKPIKLLDTSKRTDTSQLMRNEYERRANAAKAKNSMGVLAGLTVFGLSALLGTAFSPIAVPFLATGGFLISLGGGLGLIIQRNASKTEIQRIKELKALIDNNKPNYTFHLESDVGFGNKPVLLYSFDGKNFFFKDLEQAEETNQWKLDLFIPGDAKRVEYKVAKAPYEWKGDTLDGLVWQATSDNKNAFFDIQGVEFKVNKKGLKELPDCINPNWVQ